MNTHRRKAAAGLIVRLGAAIAVCAVAACGDPVDPGARKDVPRPISPPTSPLATSSGTAIYNVQFQSEGFAVWAYFGYTGKGTPIVSIGKTADIFNSLITWQPAKNMNNGYWLARVGGLEPGHQYYIRVDDLTSSWSGTVKTLRRRLTVDINKVHINFDGDAGIACGEMEFFGRMYPKSYMKNWSSGDSLVEQHTNFFDACSGGDVYPSDPWENFVIDDWNNDQLFLDFWVWELDSCGPFVEGTCGDKGYSSQTLQYATGGGPVSYNFKIGSSASSYPQVVWEGTVKTTFVKWW